MEWVKLDFASEPDLRDLSFAINAVLTNSVLKKSNGAGSRYTPKHDPGQETYAEAVAAYDGEGGGDDIPF